MGKGLVERNDIILLQYISSHPFATFHVCIPMPVTCFHRIPRMRHLSQRLVESLSVGIRQDVAGSISCK